MAKKKYELLPNATIEVSGVVLHRIKALKDFGKVKQGDLGGYIQSELNLNQKGLSWVSDNAKVYNNARVYEDAQISGTA